MQTAVLDAMRLAEEYETPIGYAKKTAGLHSNLIGALGWIAGLPDDCPVCEEEIVQLDRVQVGESIYAQTQAQADALNRFIETGE